MRFARFLALRPSDRLLVLQAAIAGPLVRAALGVLGFRRCYLGLEKLARLPRTPALPPAAQDEVARAARLVQAAWRHGPLDPHCLTQSLTLWWLLRRRGIDSDIRIGVRKVGEELEAHAWVEWSGTALTDHPQVSRKFAPLVSTSNPADHPRMRAS
jgi:hypothetical protein